MGQRHRKQQPTQSKQMMFEKETFNKFMKKDWFDSYHSVQNLQTKLYRSKIEGPFCLYKALCKKFLERGWFKGNDVEYYAEIANDFVYTVCRKVPPCVTFCILRIFFNGWATTGRFQQDDKVCRLCFDCTGRYRIEHYGVCRYQWLAFSMLFNKSIFLMTLERFFGLPRHPYVCCLYRSQHQKGQWGNF